MLSVPQRAGGLPCLAVLSTQPLGVGGFRGIRALYARESVLCVEPVLFLLLMLLLFSLGQISFYWTVS